MIDTKELRRLAQAALIGPDGVSMRWLKLLKDFQEEANPSVISEIIDRLEAAEEDRSNFLVEMGKLCAQCDALRAKNASLVDHLEAAEKERDDLLEALRGMFAMWRSVCRAQGWEPEHLAEAVRAQAAIAKATG